MEISFDLNLSLAECDKTSGVNSSAAHRAITRASCHLSPSHAKPARRPPNACCLEPHLEKEHVVLRQVEDRAALAGRACHAQARCDQSEI
eukprot:6189582-Pleurochrysis_carterae.AAC.2